MLMISGPSGGGSAGWKREKEESTKYERKSEHKSSEQIFMVVEI
jgi:hypothetical protein